MLFPLRAIATYDDDLSMPTRIVRFGDGYEERSPDGLNRFRESWDVEVFYADGLSEGILNDFLKSHGQSKPFQWFPPRDYPNAQNYVITGVVSGATRRGGGEKPWFWTRRLKFERWYGFVLPLLFLRATPLDSPSLGANQGGWMVTRSGDIESPLQINYSILVTPATGVPYTVIGWAIIPGGEVGVEVSTIGNVSGVEVLTLTAGAYELPANASFGQVSGSNITYMVTTGGARMVTNTGVYMVRS